MNRIISYHDFIFELHTDNVENVRKKWYLDLDEKEFEEIPAHRYGRVEEIADLIAFLCSDNASYITGSKIAVDGAYIKTV